MSRGTQTEISAKVRTASPTAPQVQTDKTPWKQESYVPDDIENYEDLEEDSESEQADKVEENLVEEDLEEEEREHDSEEEEREYDPEDDYCHSEFAEPEEDDYYHSGHGRQLEELMYRAHKRLRLATSMIQEAQRDIYDVHLQLARVRRRSWR